MSTAAWGRATPGNPDGSGEAVLDIEQVLSLAPAAKVDVYEAPNSGQGDLDAFTAMVQNPSVKVISTSWGECEQLTGSSLAKAENTIFEEAPSRASRCMRPRVTAARPTVRDPPAGTGARWASMTPAASPM